MEEVAALQVRLEATAARFERDMRRAQRSLDRTARSMERRANTLDRRLQKVGDRFGINIPTRAVAAAAAITAIGVAARSVARNGDQFRLLESRLTALTGSAEEGEKAFAGLLDIANNVGAPIADVASAMSRFTLAADAINATTDEVAQLTSTILKLGRIGGGSQQELSAGAIQLAQALASGRLQGDELRSVLENLPLVARAIADGLGVGVGQLRDMASEGELTARRVFDAILSKTDEVNEDFQKLPVTLDQASNKLVTSWAKFTASLDQSLGVSRALVSTLTTASATLDALITKQEKFDGARVGRSGGRGGATGRDSVPLSIQRRAAQSQLEGAGTARGRALAQRRLDRINELISAADANDPRVGGFSVPAPPGPSFAPGSSPSPGIRGLIDLTTETEPSRGGGGSSSQPTDREAVAFIERLRERIQLLDQERQAAAANGRARAELTAGFERERIERELLTVAAKDGNVVTDEQIILAQNMAREVEAATLALFDQQEAVRSLAEEEEKAAQRQEDFNRALADTANRFVGAIQQADSFKDALKNIGLELLNLAVQGAFGQGPLGDILGSAFSSIGGSFAKGGAFKAGNVVPFAAGGVVSSPTAFPMSRGRTGLMGEAGPEAIIPLARGVDGKLGVKSSGGGQSVVINTTIDARGADMGVEQRLKAVLDERDRRLPAQIRDISRRNK